MNVRNLSNIKKTLDKILGGRSDANILFNDVCNLLTHPGFDMRIKGSHHIFRRIDLEEKINLQRDGNNAKPYQARQVRHIILKYNLGEEINE